MTQLHQKINTQKEALKNFNAEIFEIPAYISGNLRHDLFSWQVDALENLLYYNNPQSGYKKPPTHLMFNMATGAGKTLLMAACLLYYYKEHGCRHFIFFVNQTNIIDKTENNFLNPHHNKYLFKDNIVIDNQTVTLRQVEAFGDTPETGVIEIKFTTIQKLYNDIHIEKENRTTLEDLQKKDIVMLADEAHHLNADTGKIKKVQLITEEMKNNTSKDVVEKRGWEHTVIDLILNKDGKKNSKNVLMEFTATIPEGNEVQKKYKDKILHKFGLKEFLKAGYTKEVNLISTTLDKKERALHALAFHWYRHRVALNNGLVNFKPVILFRSQTIEESQQDYDEFFKWVDELNVSDFYFMREIENKIQSADRAHLFEQGKFRTQTLLDFIRQQRDGYAQIVRFIKANFTKTTVIITDSRDNRKGDDEKEKRLNSLEDKNNHIRAIFTVKRLTEGWDVLNLFDIVRLSGGRRADGNGGGHTKEATTQEKQLIGRGVRYYPFAFADKQNNERKFDDDLNHEMRILEELFYYTYEESAYISDLKQALRDDGYINDDKVRTLFDLKEKFKSDVSTKQMLWCNEREDNPGQIKDALEEIKKALNSHPVTHKISGMMVAERAGIDPETKPESVLKTREEVLVPKSKKLGDVEKHIFQKAVHIKAKQAGSVFRFENMKEKLPVITGMDNLHDKLFKDVTIKLKMPKGQSYDDLAADEKLRMCLKFLDTLSDEMDKKIRLYKGGPFAPVPFKTVFGEPKIKYLPKPTNEEARKKAEKARKKAEEIVAHPWYALDNFAGTDLEEKLVDFVKDFINEHSSALDKKFEHIYLLRNEEVYKIYDFEEGRGFQPDFLLFLKENGGLYYQAFIEPKNEKLSVAEEWKEKFLLQIAEKHEVVSTSLLFKESEDYKLIGYPFYNDAKAKEFEEEFNKLLDPSNKKTK